MELRDAIDQITTIRTQLAATERLRSLRAVPVALSGLAALAAAAVQKVWLGDGTPPASSYLALWLAAALLSGLAAGAEIARRAFRSDSPLGLASARLAALQFLPCLLAGAAVTVMIPLRLPEHVWLLPGLWQLLFGLGNLAAQQLLPAAARWVGLAFLASGTACLWLGERALDPWAMGLPFATGQLVLAAILWWHHERTDLPAEMRR